MKIILKINDIIVTLEKIMIGAAILIMSVTLIANVFGRWLFDKGVYAAEEIGQYCIYAITFIGLSYAVTCGKHINMLGLFDMLGHKAQKVLALIISLVTAGTMGLLTAICFQYTATLKMMGKVSINLHVPTYIVVAIVGMGFLFTTLQFILVFVKNIREKEIYLGLDHEYVPDFKREEAK